MDRMMIEFRSIAEKKWSPYGELNHRNFNRCFDQLKKIAAELKAKNAIGELSVFLDDPEDCVKYEAAVKLLPVSEYTQKSEKVLEEIGMGRGMLPFNAEQALELWRSGKWLVDY